MVLTNLTTQPQKKAKGVTINDGGSNPPKRNGEELPPRDKSKRKKHITRKGLAIETQVEFSEPEDEEPLTHRRSRRQARSQSSPTRVPTAATTPETDSPVTQTSPTETPTAAPGGSGTTIPSDVTQGTDAHNQSTTTGTKAPTDGATIVLSPEGKDQIGGEIEQWACHQEVSRSSTIPPNDPRREDGEGKR
ncbi:hypothetical protein H5410_027070 [Solanum commersonii]|uniref:Integrase core domain containing protein n=1 Tax=Solanum commersonii TaxID=4109 RepID=A0A9J5YYU1_SOLCO|nr:hypothetical protein H5410_027070 [Solanum commersonii]